MQSRPELHEFPALQICPSPPVSVQVCAEVSQPSPFLQSESAAHCTQVPPEQTGVAGGQVPDPVQPVSTTHLLVESQTSPLAQSLPVRHCTQSGNGVSRQTGVGGAQSEPWVAAVQTGLHASFTQLFPCGHCVPFTHSTHAPLPVSQCGVAASEAQSVSDLQVAATQVFCAQVLPAPQSAGCTHCTQPPVCVLQCGLARFCAQ